MEAALMVVAAGSGTRMGTAVRKPFLELAGRMILLRALDAFQECGFIRRRVVVLATADFGQDGRLTDPELDRELRGCGVDAAVAGGAERVDSVRAGLAACGDSELILIHDGVRPFASAGLTERVARAAFNHGAAVPGIPVTDTIRRVDSLGYAAGTPLRSELRAIQTPQGFRRAVLEQALSAADRGPVTDEATLCEILGIPVLVVPGEPGNLKITTATDLAIAEAMLAGKTAPRTSA